MHRCQLCPERYCTQKELTRHLETVHPGKANYTCDVCGRGYVTKSALTTHKHKHAGTELLGRGRATKGLHPKFNVENKRKSLIILVRPPLPPQKGNSRNIDVGGS